MGLEWRRIPATLGDRMAAHLPWALICGGVLALTAWISPVRAPTVCPLFRLTRIPCPACGSTRAFHDAGHGRWRNAARHNTPALIAYFACWAGFLFHGAALVERRKWSLRWTAGKRGRAWLLALGAAWILLSWGSQLIREKNRSGEIPAKDSRQ